VQALYVVFQGFSPIAAKDSGLKKIYKDNQVVIFEVVPL
jgi:hypothetical protein